MLQQKTWVEISRSAYQHNLNLFRRKTGSSVQMMAILKANAYGHGLLEVAQLSQELVDAYGVDSIDEAIRLRQFGIRHPILVLGYVPLARLNELPDHDLMFSLYNREALEVIRQLPAKTFKAHLEIETGLTRQGIELKDLHYFTTQDKKPSNLQILGLMTHFANVEEQKSRAFTQDQLAKFQLALEFVRSQKLDPTMIHTACSAAAWMEPNSLFNTVRLGIGQYGLWSSDDMRLFDRSGELQPVLTWKTRIAQIKQIKAGTQISYGMTESVDRDSIIAVLPVGYWDGIDRVAYSSQGNVVIKNKICKVLGRVCMNMMMVDISTVPNVSVNDEVILLGPGVSAEDIAKMRQTINYEVVTNINPLIPRTITE